MPVNIAIRCISHLLTSLDDGPLYFSSSIFCKLELRKRFLAQFLRALARCIRRLFRVSSVSDRALLIFAIPFSLSVAMNVHTTILASNMPYAQSARHYQRSV